MMFDATSPAVVLRFNQLWAQAKASRHEWAASPGWVIGQQAVGSIDATLCFCYTGGTTKASRCARVTHRMALHEVDAYPHMASLGCEDRVLQQHSLFWGASAYGEIDIAIAFGCALVFCKAWDTGSVASVIRRHGVTCAGLVPSILAALDHVEVPSLALVFTWGEALKTQTARAWAEQAHLIDLLISTECWLSLYADWGSPLGRAAIDNPDSEKSVPRFRTVPGTLVRLQTISTDGASGAAHGALSTAGELIVAGPMVSPGYTDVVASASVFESDGAGTNWYHTRDCLERHGVDGFVFAGRADDFIKVGGKWLDVSEVERQLRGGGGAAVTDVCICGHHAFVTLCRLDGSVVHTLRSLLPSDFELFLVPVLPRHAGTGKVDRRRLGQLVEVGKVVAQQERESKLCSEELTSIQRWYGPLVLILAVALLRHGLLGAIVAGGPRRILHITMLVLQESCWRGVCLVYLLLAVWHLPAKTSHFFRNFPLGVLGISVLLCAVFPYPVYVSVFALPGGFLAWWRKRFLSWPLVCSVGFPLWARDAGWWMRDRGWWGSAQWYVRWYVWRYVQPLVCAPWKFACRLWLYVSRRVGISRECKWCKRYVALCRGYVDKTVDAHWYCGACWRRFYNHRQCSRCQDWSLKGCTSTATGLWLCNTCNHPCMTPPARQDARNARGISSNGWSRRSIGERTVSVPDQRIPDRTGVADFSSDDCHMGVSPPPMKTAELGPARKRPRMGDAAAGLRGGWGGNSNDNDPACHHCNSNSIATCAAPVPIAKSKSREWKIIETATAITFGSLSDSLLVLDSLRRTKMSSALRRKAGKRLPHDALKRAVTLGDLLGEIERLPEEQSNTDFGVGERSDAQREFAAWGIMWQSKCQWIFRRSRPLSEAVLRSAIDELMLRHPALTAELQDTYRLFAVTQKALTGFEVWRRHGTHLRLEGGTLWAVSISWAARWLGRAVRWSFLNAWPRVASTPVAAAPLTVFERSPTVEEAERRIWWCNSYPFVPPFRAALAPFGSEVSEEGALVHLVVSHMLSDGYSVVPLLDDLAHLVARAEGAALPRLPAVPNMFAALEQRIAHTINGGDGNGCTSAVPMSDGITREAVGNKTWHDTYTHFVPLPADEVHALRRSAHRLAVPEDVAMLSVLGVTLAWLEGNKAEPIAVITPYRDGPGELLMIGLFADVRHLVVSTEGLSFAGVALRLNYIVKERLWLAPGLATQFDVTLVNFEWTDFEERHGFVQQVSLLEGSESSFHPLRVAVDQPGPDTWRMRVTFAKQRYDEGRREKFLELFERSLRALLERPLDLVWPPDE